MIAAVSGSHQEVHSTTIRVFQNQIIDNNLGFNPFQLSLKSIISTDVEKNILLFRMGNNFYS